MLGVVAYGDDAVAGKRTGGSPGSMSGGKMKERHDQRTSGRPIHLQEPMDHPWVDFARQVGNHNFDHCLLLPRAHCRYVVVFCYPELGRVYTHVCCNVKPAGVRASGS